LKPNASFGVVMCGLAGVAGRGCWANGADTASVRRIATTNSLRMVRR
jgi:hypothetical protein